MKIKLLSIASVFLFGSIINAQQDTFHATMDAKNALELQKKYPKEVVILQTYQNESAVNMTENAAHQLHRKVLSHGPGYVFQSSSENALASITSKKNTAHRIIDFNISESVLVNQSINLVNSENIKNHIQVLENYGTRRHDTAKAKQAVLDLKTKWETMIAASGRTDISVKIVDHINTPMPSLIMTFTGKETPSEFVIIGGHSDSISDTNSAPGADDNASGIATLTEMIRVLLAVNYQPKKTVEFMAFSAEEIGLVGSNEIATDYANNNVDVLAYVQFDMTNYKGSTKDVYLTTDSYNSNDLNLFLMELMEHYNKTGSHIFTYGNTICNYGCSDHFSWAQNGYNAAFPFEATMDEHNPYIHSSQDKLSISNNNANHATKFAKLGLEFIIEAAKSYTGLATNDINTTDIQLVVQNNQLRIVNQQNLDLENLWIVDSSGKKLLEKSTSLKENIDLNNLPKGIYLALLKTKQGKSISKKFIIQ